MFQIDFHDVSALRPSFWDLPEDDYTDGGFRFRRLGNFESDGVAFWQVGSSIMQPADINSYLGDIQRTYAPLKDEIVFSESFMSMIFKFQRMTGWMGDFDVHQMRLLATNGKTAEPAPEGIHRDGYEFIVPFMVMAENCKGGKPQIYDLHSKQILANLQPLPDMVMVFNDRKMRHFATPITQKDPTRPAYWDAFVIAANPDD